MRLEPIDAEAKWCVRCGEKGKAMRAQFELDGELYCTSCLLAEGYKLQDGKRLEPAICRTDDCHIELIPSNTSGFCCAHLAKAEGCKDNGQRRGKWGTESEETEATVAKSKGECSEPDYEKPVQVKDKCRAHYEKARYAAMKKERALGAPTSAQIKPEKIRAEEPAPVDIDRTNVLPDVPRPEANVVTVQLCGEHLNNWWGKLGTAEKATLFTTWLDWQLA